jgi:hypothetical protein
MTIILQITPDTPPAMLKTMATVLHMLVAQEPEPTAEPIMFEHQPLPDTLPADTPIYTPAEVTIPYTPEMQAEAAAIADMMTPKVDSEGLPWDQRIHAASRAINADGTWRQRRNVDQELLEQVRAELRQTMGASAPLVPPPPRMVPVPPAPEVDGPISPVSLSNDAVVVPPPPPLNPTGYVTLLTRLATDKANGVLSAEAVDAAVGSLGLPSLAALVARPDLVPALEMLVYGNQ